MDKENEIVEIDYTNHRGERRLRRVHPMKVIFGTTKWHSGEQWFLLAWDEEKQEPRMFALADIHGWRRPSVLDEQPELVDKMSKCPHCGSEVKEHIPETADEYETWVYDCGAEIFLVGNALSIETGCRLPFERAVRKLNEERSKG